MMKVRTITMAVREACAAMSLEGLRRGLRYYK